MADTDIRNENDGGRSGWIVAIIILVVVVLFLLFGLPYLQDNGTVENEIDEEINVNVPEADLPDPNIPEINVPEDVDVNVDQGDGVDPE